MAENARKQVTGPSTRRAERDPRERQSGQESKSARGWVRELQSKAGNRAVNRLMDSVQTKLQVGPAGDRYEREADAVAREIIRSLRGGPQRDLAVAPPESAPLSDLRRSSGVAEVGADGGPVSASTEEALRAARQGGSPLPKAPRATMEQAFGADFSSVRIHQGAASRALNDTFQARAFTVGSDIFFRQAAPNLSTSAGQELLAHELTHTVQQGAAAVRRKAVPGTPAARAKGTGRSTS